MFHKPSFAHAFITVTTYLVVFSISGAYADNPPRQERVINGNNASTFYPWMASIGSSDLDPARGHFCGGVLIDERFILTAAHCVEDSISYPHYLSVTIGRMRLADSGGITVIADGVIVHPDFNPSTQENDLALVRLSEPVRGVPFAPVLGAADEAMLSPGTEATLLGWGSTDPLFPLRPQHLQEATIPIIAQNICEERHGLDFYPDTMMCAGILSSQPAVADGVDSCYGDSGGPLIVSTPLGPQVLALTSWGIACASDRYWGVYARVAPHREWIMSARIVAPYFFAEPEIQGAPVVGSNLVCRNSALGGDAALGRRTEWLDFDTGEVLGIRKNYRVKRGDVGRKVACMVSAFNQAGEMETISQAIGPIYPKQARIKLSPERGSPAVKLAGLFCLDRTCSFLISFRESMSSVRVLVGGQANARWRSATKISSNTWQLNFKGRNQNFSGVIMRAVKSRSGKGSVYQLKK